jgi:ABC-2 type transport system permease protein
MSISHLLAIARKELQHILRVPSTLVLVLITPTALLFLMAYALTVDISNVPVAVWDQDQSQSSREFIDQIMAGEDLDYYAVVSSMDEIKDLFVHGDIKAATIIHPEFSERLLTFEGIPLQIIIDGTEPESGNFAVDHIVNRVERYFSDVLFANLQLLTTQPIQENPIDLRIQTWYNPALEPRNDLVPGLISMVLGMPALSVALAIAYEREHGTLEQLLATPIGRWELLVGKMIPYILVGLLNVILIPLLAIIWFNIPFHGNFLLFFGLSAVFLFAILSMGLVVGVFMRTQAAALALSFLVIFFPGFFLTGIFFPIVSMPDIMRMESLALPGTHYAIITRAIFLTGSGLEVLWPYLIMLMLLGFVFTGIAALFFRKKLG